MVGETNLRGMKCVNDNKALCLWLCRCQLPGLLDSVSILRPGFPAILSLDWRLGDSQCSLLSCHILNYALQAHNLPCRGLSVWMAYRRFTGGMNPISQMQG